MRFAFVARERAHYPTWLLCRVLAVSVTGFHDYLRRQGQGRHDADAALRSDLHVIHTGSRGTYGRPRLVRALRVCGHAVGPKRVARLMREEGLGIKGTGNKGDGVIIRLNFPLTARRSAVCHAGEPGPAG